MVYLRKKKKQHICTLLPYAVPSFRSPPGYVLYNNISHRFKYVHLSYVFEILLRNAFLAYDFFYLIMLGMGRNACFSLQYAQSEPCMRICVFHFLGVPIAKWRFFHILFTTFETKVMNWCVVKSFLAYCDSCVKSFTYCIFPFLGLSRLRVDKLIPP